MRTIFTKRNMLLKRISALTLPNFFEIYCINVYNLYTVAQFALIYSFDKYEFMFKNNVYIFSTVFGIIRHIQHAI
jgi:hypothetical protein